MQMGLSDSSMPRYSYDEAAAKMEAFERLLSDHGVTVRPGSLLERIGLEVLRLPDVMRDRAGYPLDRDIREYFAEVMGLNDLVDKILRVRGNASFQNLVPYLKLLNEGQPSQAVGSLPTDQAANRLFELLIGAASMQFSGSVALDAIPEATRRNPDVMPIALGKVWGIACKVIHTSSTQTFVDRVEEGLQQIDRSTADRGIVLISMKNRLDIDSVWPLANRDEVDRGADPLYRAHASLTSALRTVHRAADEFARTLAEEAGLRNLASTIARGKSILGVALFFPVATGIKLDIGPTPTFLPSLITVRAGTLRDDDWDFLDLLQASLVNGKPPKRGRLQLSPVVNRRHWR